MRWKLVEKVFFILFIIFLHFYKNMVNDTENEMMENIESRLGSDYRMQSFVRDQIVIL